MPDCRLMRCLLCLGLLLCLVSGCQVFHADPSIRVVVRDAETKKPLTTAEVYVCSRLKGEEIAPCHGMGLTQEDGSAQLRLEKPGEGGIQLQTIAQGYVPEKLNVKADALPQETTKRDLPAEFVVEMYAEPSFSVELILPKGFRGLVQATVAIRDEMANPPGQRRFRYAVAPTGLVEVAGPSLLGRVAPEAFRARNFEGSLLDATMDAQKVGFRWLKNEGDTHYYVVGTLTQFEDEYRKLTPEQVRSAHASDGHAKKRFKGKRDN